MVKKKHTEDQKRKIDLRLWWEYLKRSDIYKEYCEFSREDNNKDFQKEFRFDVKEDEFRKKFGAKACPKKSINPPKMFLR